MNNTICYLNTDLYLISANDLTPIAEIFKAHGILSLQLARAEDGLWYANIEWDDEHGPPESAIADMITVVESFDDLQRRIWLGCTRCEFDIGYDCGEKPWAFNQGLSTELLGRMAAVRASLRITLYPDNDRARAAT